MTLVSVIIAVYNCERYIQKALDSILQQSYQNLEVLICDDCSTDNSWSLLSAYTDSRIRLFKNKKNQGVVATRNFLFEQATGDFFLIQDADDWSSPNRVDVLLELFNSNPTADACCTAHFRVSNTNKLTIHGNANLYQIDINHCENLPFMPPTLIFSRKVYQQIGGYHPFFANSFAEDWYWVIRVVEKFKMLFLNQPLYYYRFNPNSITNTFTRKEDFIVPDLIRELLQQRKSTGTDWVETSDAESIQTYADKKFRDRKWLSNKYRIAAAVQRDGKKRLEALKLIGIALWYNPLAFNNYATFRYIVSYVKAPEQK
jgi:glycosyltransferase involved in cell wall biosynthesis